MASRKPEILAGAEVVLGDVEAELVVVRTALITIGRRQVAARPALKTVPTTPTRQPPSLPSTVTVQEADVEMEDAKLPVAVPVAMPTANRRQLPYTISAARVQITRNPDAAAMWLNQEFGVGEGVLATAFNGYDNIDNLLSLFGMFVEFKPPEDPPIMLKQTQTLGLA